MIKINWLFFITFIVPPFLIALHFIFVPVIVDHLFEQISVDHPDIILILLTLMWDVINFPKDTPVVDFWQPQNSEPSHRNVLEWVR